MIGQSPEQGQAPTVVNVYNPPVTEDASVSNVQQGGPFREDITYAEFMVIDGVMIKLGAVIAALAHPDGGCVVYLEGVNGKAVRLENHTVEQFFKEIQ